MSVGRSQALANERCCLCELERLRSSVSQMQR